MSNQKTEEIIDAIKKTNKGLKFLVLSEEKSGEIYTGKLITAIKKKFKNCIVEGVGSDNFRKAGGNTLFDTKDFSAYDIVSAGFKGVLNHIKLLKLLKKRISENQYNAIIIIDYPGINLRIAKYGYKSGTPVFYYVSPNVWIHKSYRAKKIKKYVDIVFPNFAIEEEFYKKYSVVTKFHGHPIIDELPDPLPKAVHRERLGIPTERTVLGIFPGSRNSEISYHLPELVKAINLIKHKIDVDIIVSKSDMLDETNFDKLIAPVKDKVAVIKGKSWDLINSSDLMLAKAGTTTLEAAIANVPMIVFYKLNVFSFLYIKILHFYKVQKSVSLPNIVSKREFIPEFLQFDFSSDRMSRCVFEMLGNKERLHSLSKNLLDFKDSLGEKGVASKVVDDIAEFISKLGYEDLLQD